MAADRSPTKKIWIPAEQDPAQQRPPKTTWANQLITLTSKHRVAIRTLTFWSFSMSVKTCGFTAATSVAVLAYAYLAFSPSQSVHAQRNPESVENLPETLAEQLIGTWKRVK
jgi:hypothetical protein